MQGFANFERCNLDSECLIPFVEYICGKPICCYSEIGLVINHQILYNLFPLALIDPDLVSPLMASKLLQCILVPEISVQLIIQDKNLDKNQMRDAVKILQESANYSVYMFPVDKEEENKGIQDNSKLGAADMIVMKR